VDACLLVAAKREPPLVAHEHRELFRAFVRGAFNGRGNVVGKALRPVFTKKQIRRLAHNNGFSTDSFPSQLTVHQWLSVFKFMVGAVSADCWPVAESAAKHSLGGAGLR
jgi:16S rRNA A1518/A1519 N6-dimethyltransferase RsmA/KsgA/DIM1 with predicted DNA glycosylase/AP lyase activity